MLVVRAARGRPGAAAPQPAKRPAPTLAIALASVGVVALGTSLYFGLKSHDQYEDFKTACAPYCPKSDADSVRSKALVSDIALLTSAAAFSAAAWFYFSASAQHPAAAVNLTPTPQGATAQLRLVW